MKIPVRHFITAGLTGLFFSIQLPQATQASELIRLSQEAQKAAADGRFNSLQKIENILKEVSLIRKLPVLAPVNLTVITREALKAELAEKIRTEISPEKMESDAALYQQLGMIPRDFDYPGFMLALYTEQIGGFYDPKTRALKLIEGIPMTGAEQEILIAHELTHALQDQHYHLDDLLNAPERKESDDATLALMALVEGDATVSAMNYLQESQRKKPLQGFFANVGLLMNQFKMLSSFKTFQSAPPFIQEQLIFPYQQGSQFVNYFHSEGLSWSEMQTLYDHAPSSTEHILHPRTYAQGDTPRAIDWDLASWFPGTRVISHSVWGELSYRQYFERHLDWKQAKAAASGWAGDRYAVLEGDDGPFFVFASRWDNIAEASEFAAAYHQSLITRTGKTPELLAPGLWRSESQDHGQVFLWHQTERVLVCERLPKGFKDNFIHHADFDF